jgi:hypothetical protein
VWNCSAGQRAEAHACADEAKVKAYDIARRALEEIVDDKTGGGRQIAAEAMMQIDFHVLPVESRIRLETQTTRYAEKNIKNTHPAQVRPAKGGYVEVSEGAYDDLDDGVVY